MTAAERLVLYTDTHWISPYAFSCFVAIHEKRLPFETQSIALAEGEHERPEYRDRAITGRVPALEHRGFFLAESSAIIEYLDEVFPAPAHARVMPEDVRARARARQIMAWIRSDLMSLRGERPTATMFYERAAKPLSEAGQAAAGKLLRAADILIEPGATSMFGAWSAADADLAFALMRLILNGHDVPAKIRAFADAQWARPSVRAFVERERHPLSPPA